MKESCLKILSAYGYTGEKAEACADDWCSKQVTTNGLKQYYEAYFRGQS